jgi:hypothetical protein
MKVVGEIFIKRALKDGKINVIRKIIGPVNNIALKQTFHILI